MRTAVVTGSSSGIGRATAELLLATGWQVIGLDRAAPTGDVAFRSVTVDLADMPRLHEVMASLADEPIEGLVNCAATQLNASIDRTDVDSWAAVMTVNVGAPFHCLRLLRGALAASGGSVVNVASVHALATSPGIAAYAASKGALVALTRATAVELAPEGIRVNAVCPGAIDTPMLDEGLKRVEPGLDPAQTRSRLISRTPLGTIGRPEDAAEAIGFLLDGDRSGFITGQTIVVDGGVLARLATE